jgi:hypothetical protein
MTRRVSLRGGEPSGPDEAGSTEEQSSNGAKPSLARRALLTRGGVVAAGVVGAGAVGAVSAGSASADSGDPILQDTVNNAGSSSTVTELDADNNTAPAFILTNTGVDPANSGSGPNLRLTPSPSTATGNEPTASTAGGDLTATADGYLWFTHDFTASLPSGVLDPARVLTEATGNVYAALAAPDRILDTRTSAGRANITNPTGNLASDGRLLAGKTIYINLASLAIFAEAVFANLTVTDTAAAGFVTVWSGFTALPNTSSINFGAGATLSNFVSCAAMQSDVDAMPTSVFAIYAEETTHVIVDVAGLTVPGFEDVKFALSSGPLSERNKRIRAARAAARNSKHT